jgi:phosphodiesterase/alkaline phosphatase D-like protein
MGNMMDDIENDRIDAILHIGDHCYNLGGNDERRGDAYVVFERTCRSMA